jgi:hypothetical protein
MTILLFVTGDACTPKKMGENPTRIIKNIPAVTGIPCDNKQP